MQADLLLATVLLYFNLCMVTASIQLQTFSILTDHTKTICDLGYRFTNTTPISCGILCMTSSVFCRSFIHSQQTGECRGGSWLVLSGPSTQIVNDEKIYHSSNFCNTTDFTITTTENHTYCIFLSNKMADYFMAKADCKARGAHLFTPKNAEKLKIMKGLLDPSIINAWFGLNDLVTEGEFRWEDDDTKLDEVWKIKLFTPGEPSNSVPWEDCVVYCSVDYVNDFPCSYTFRYMCEIDFN